MNTARPQALGKALGIVARARAAELIMHEDVNAFHAPSECHALVSKGEDKRMRLARRRAKAASGLSRAAFRRALRRHWRAVDAATCRIYARAWIA